MDKKSKNILAVVIVAFALIIAVKPFLSGNTEVNAGIDTNPNYAQAIAQAKAQGQPVFLEFYGNNWPTCIAMRPVVQGMAEKYGKQVRFIVADVATTYGNKLAKQYQIMYIPAMYFIGKDGEVVDSFVGKLTEEELEAKLKNILK